MISVTGGKLVVEPITLTRAQASALRRRAGRYVADKKKMTVPLRVFVPQVNSDASEEDVPLLKQVFAYVKGLFDEQNQEAIEGQDAAATKPATKPATLVAARGSAKSAASGINRTSSKAGKTSSGGGRATSTIGRTSSALDSGRWKSGTVGSMRTTSRPSKGSGAQSRLSKGRNTKR